MKVVEKTPRVPMLKRLAPVLVVASMVAVITQVGGVSGAAGVPTDPGNQLNVASTVSELPVPPTVPSNGVCTNPTGCLSASWGSLSSPGFFWQPGYVLVGVDYAGAPSSGPSSIYNGEQVVLEKTDGTFPDGDAWQCLTCGVTLPSGVIQSDFGYPPPHALPGDTRILVGNGILQCTDASGALLVVTDPNCTAAHTQISPIYWGTSPLGGPGGLEGNGREWRLSPDGVHMEWDNISYSGGNINEYEFEGALSWDATNQRYDLTNVYFLPQTNRGWVVRGKAKTGQRLVFKPKAMIGEARGWSSNGKSILGIQSYEDNSVDAWETNLTSSRSKPLTVHAQYTDPMFMAPNGKYMVNDEVAGSGRMDWLSGLEGVAPIATSLVTIADVSEMRNAGNRRFFEPWITSTSAPLTEQVNAATADPNWNAGADPVWTADSTAVVYAENFACGANASGRYCAGSGEPGGRNSRLMIARLALPPSKPKSPVPISNTAPSSWAVPYTGQALPGYNIIPTGTYTITGDVAGTATVAITDNSSDTGIQTMDITYSGYEQAQGMNVINGTEDISTSGDTFGNITWNENITANGQQGSGTQVTSPGGFTINTLDLLESNNFQATGTMTTTLNGVTYTQPSNGN